MIRWLLIAVLLAPFAAHAQGEPRLEIDLPKGEVIVGQPVTMRLKLLVPTWMPKPPVWPTLEVPSLLVRLPERASTPVSEIIEGETWSGISRAYRLYPLEVGGYKIPAQKLIVTYADPGKPDPIVAELTLEPIRFSAGLPKGAEGLSPPIVARGLTLEQQVIGGPDLMVGDAVTRSITVSIEGTTPILLPDLMPELLVNTAPAPLRAYPKEPVVTETETRGVLSGNRTDSTTYVAQAGGDLKLAPISLSWFNLDSGQVESLESSEITLSITAPPPPPPGVADYARWTAMALAGIGMIWAIMRLIWPRLRHLLTRVARAWQASEVFAHRRVIRAIRARDLNATLTALDQWAVFYRDVDQPSQNAIAKALARAGAETYGSQGTRAGITGWANTARAYSELRARNLDLCRMHRESSYLPDLNPSGGKFGL